MKWFPDGPSKQHAIRQATVPPARKEAMAVTSDPSPTPNPVLFIFTPSPYWLPTQPIKQQGSLTPKQAFLLPWPCTTSILRYSLPLSLKPPSICCLPSLTQTSLNNLGGTEFYVQFCKRKIKKGWGRNSKQSNPHFLHKCTCSFERKWLFTSFLKNKNKQENSPSTSSHFFF